MASKRQRLEIELFNQEGGRPWTLVAKQSLASGGALFQFGRERVIAVVYLFNVRVQHAFGA